jgi:hypothetical protein
MPPRRRQKRAATPASPPPTEPSDDVLINSYIILVVVFATVAWYMGWFGTLASWTWGSLASTWRFFVAVDRREDIEAAMNGIRTNMDLLRQDIYGAAYEL